MITENLSTLKIHKLTQEQYDRELEAGNIDSSAIYLTPDEDIDIFVQNDEPTEAEEGALWVDMDAEGESGGNGVIKVYKDGVWEEVSGVSGHSHSVSDIVDFPSSMPANGGDADTVDGKHASYFASAADIEDLQNKVGNTSISDQINTAISNKSDVGHAHTVSAISDFPSSMPANGGDADTVDGKHASYFATASHGTHVTYSTSNPKMNGTASAGTNSTVSRGDHVHPTDTTRASAEALGALKNLVGSTSVSSQISTAIAGKSDVGHDHDDEYAPIYHGTHVTHTTTVPKMNGTASVGTDSTVSRSDHVHPTDTTRASSSDLNALKNLVGTTAVSTQISDALANFSSGKTLTEHLAEENMVLTSLQYGDTLPDPGTPGRIFFLKVSD